MQVTRRIHIGGVTKTERLQRLVRAHVEINPIGQQLFADERFRTLSQPSILESVKTTAASLGLSRGGTFAHVIEAAATRGLSVCPLELGPHLRLRLLDQAEGASGFNQTKHQAPPGSISVESAPLSEDEETSKDFYLCRIDGTLWLRSYKSWSGHMWAPEDVFIFAQA